jgi:hypothetical protein
LTVICLFWADGAISSSLLDLLVTGMPATCVTLATTITGEFNAGRPVPQGNDAILFTDLEEHYFTEIADALRARGD